MKGRIGLWVVLSALLWILVGGISTYMVTRPPRPPDLAQAADRIAVAMDRLRLEESQRNQVSSIVSRYQDEVLHADQQFWQAVSQAEQQADSAIEALLSEEQRLKYQELVLGER